MKKVVITLIGILVLSHLAWAGYDYQFDTRMNPHGQYESEMGAKLSRGVGNIAFGWTEIIRTPVEWARPVDRGFVSAVFIGLPYGIFRFVGRTLVGVYEVATFYAPQGPIMADIQGDVL